MNTKRYRIFTLLTFVAGLVLLLTSKMSITGSVIGAPVLSGSNEMIGLFLLIISVLLFMGEGTIDRLVERIHQKAEHSKKKHRTNLNYIKGLENIERAAEQEKGRYHHAIRKPVRKIIYLRLKSWLKAIDRREKYFFKLPHHIKEVMDLPDEGLYDYRPEEGRRSKYVELEVTHYTSQGNYKSIKEAIKRKKDEIMFADRAGWAYFVDEPLPEKIETRELRKILGTGLQDYAGKERVRNPESQITFRILVPKERVVVKKQKYPVRSLPGEPEIDVKKYAIAGGIRTADIVDGSVVIGGRYLTRNLDKRHAQKEKWRVHN
ncbi:hypothetical protein ACFLZ7_01360 [Nanoarchaeota archaeon]